MFIYRLDNNNQLIKIQSQVYITIYFHDRQFFCQIIEYIFQLSSRNVKPNQSLNYSLNC